MSATEVELEIEGRARNLGDGFSVRRVLPSPIRRMVGPFIFVDHMGPIQLEPSVGVDVRPHPHIGLATVTYLFDGEMVHRDSLGNDVSIRPGDVNWMTAGRGIAHSERSPAAVRKSGAHLHGMQLWVALPDAAEETAPSFRHYPGAELPSLALPDVQLSVIAGSAFGVTSPVEVASPLFYVGAVMAVGGKLTIPDDYAERAAYVVRGAVGSDGKRHEAGSMLILRTGVPGHLEALEADTRVMLLGGAPVGERHIFWNFVSSSKERIEEAARAWRAGEFPRVAGDDQEFIPLPEGMHP